MKLRSSYIRLLPLLFIALAPQSASPQNAPSRSKAARGFRGNWEWAVYAKNKNELPPAYKGMSVKEVPATILTLKLKQRGSKLSGTYNAGARYLAKIEDGELEGTVKGSVAQFDLQSGFGGEVTVSLSLRGDVLHWKVIKSKGEAYFPNDVFLHRSK